MELCSVASTHPTSMGGPFHLLHLQRLPLSAKPSKNQLHRYMHRVFSSSSVSACSSTALVWTAGDGCFRGAGAGRLEQVGCVAAPNYGFGEPKLTAEELVCKLSLVNFNGCRSRSAQAASYADRDEAVPMSLEGLSLVHHRPGLEIDERFLNCCEPGKKLKVGVLISGGVDSSVALRLLCAAGHSCLAFYLKIWFQEDFENFWAACPWDDDLKYAQAVCDEVGVELQVVHLTEEYWRSVVSYMIAEYHAGRTPNPDILCNSRIKFGAFLDHIKNMGFDRVASGHYARVERVGTSCDGHPALLRLSQDELKDQTYFLSHLSQSQLSQLMFPLGFASKEEVRQLAHQMGLPNKDRKDSQGICFLGKVKFSNFIAKHLGEKEGCILEAETGNYLGSHKGFWFYTIGQRQGLGLSNGPWYVVEKDLENNVVFVSRDYYSIDKRRRIFQVSSINWFAGCPPSCLTNLRCKVRHGPKFYNCSLEFPSSLSNQVVEGALDGKPFRSAIVKLSEDDQGIAEGQYAAFYEGDLCLGSGIIADSLVDLNSCVSSEAYEAAKSKKTPNFIPRKSRKKTRDNTETVDRDSETNESLDGPLEKLHNVDRHEQNNYKASLKPQEKPHLTSLLGRLRQILLRFWH